jgi:hypothetical protein
MEDMDLSIVQQGFSSEGFFCTLLSLYTLYTKEIIVFPDKDCTIFYSVPLYAKNCVDFQRSYQYYVTKHYKEHGSEHFYQCLSCHHLAPVPLITWMKRLSKYANLFPDFTFYYTYAKEGDFYK